jgi:hypothetical protein
MLLCHIMWQYVHSNMYPYEVSFHGVDVGRPPGAYSNFKWTCPHDGTYSIHGSVVAVHEGSTEVLLQYDNGTRVMLRTFILTGADYRIPKPFNITVDLKKMQMVRFSTRAIILGSNTVVVNAFIDGKYKNHDVNIGT